MSSWPPRCLRSSGPTWPTWCCCSNPWGCRTCCSSTSWTHPRRTTCSTPCTSSGSLGPWTTQVPGRAPWLWGLGSPSYSSVSADWLCPLLSLRWSDLDGAADGGVSTGSGPVQDAHRVLWHGLQLRDPAHCLHALGPGHLLQAQGERLCPAPVLPGVSGVYGLEGGWERGEGPLLWRWNGEGGSRVSEEWFYCVMWSRLVRGKGWARYVVLRECSARAFFSRMVAFAS